MRTEAKVFGVIAAFLAVVAAGYGWWTWYTSGRVEAGGTTTLGLSAALCAMCGLYFAFVSRRIPLRPEDRGDADVVEGAGRLGFFAPASYWPFGIGVAAGAGALGIAYGQWWLLVVGLVALLGAAAGLVFEYYAGAPRAN
ncbi:cytochrome c oxidase subunit 4 [Planosporangium thailandense]|uniref:Cytochrome c oxidase polypeptide 4 n=1 Tax=Planosporangium thailandense TaxID=765197 RepID=A0ABX0XYS9_9ACTN|nr:cytochrome c oxidase subunit 4 [Planosporangium thailandense]